MRTPRDTANLAELYDEAVMPWSRAADALGTGSLGREVHLRFFVHRPAGRAAALGRHRRCLGGRRAVLHQRAEHAQVTRPAQRIRHVVSRCAFRASTSCWRAWPSAWSTHSANARASGLRVPRRRLAGYRRGGRAHGPVQRAECRARAVAALSAFTLATAFGVGLTPPHGASRWRFSNAGRRPVHVRSPPGCGGCDGDRRGDRPARGLRPLGSSERERLARAAADIGLAAGEYAVARRRRARALRASSKDGSRRSSSSTGSSASSASGDAGDLVRRGADHPRDGVPGRLPRRRAVRA